MEHQQNGELITERELIEETKITEISVTDDIPEFAVTDERERDRDYIPEITNELNLPRKVTDDDNAKLQEIINIIINENNLPVNDETYMIMMRAIQNNHFDTRGSVISFTPEAKKYMTTASIFAKILNLDFDRTEVEESTKNQLAYTRYLIKKFYEKINCDNTTEFSEFFEKMRNSCYADILDVNDTNLLWNFLKEEKTGTCYICNKEIVSQMEIEHVLPFAFAAQYGGIGLKNYWKLVKDNTRINDNGDLVFNFDKPYKKVQYSYKTPNKEQFEKKFIINNGQVYLNKYELLFSLLEVRESHKCCNQIKSACVFIKRNDDTGEYIPNTNGLEKYIHELTTSKSYDCHTIIGFNSDITTINENLINYFKLIATILNKIENRITQDVLTLSHGSQSQTSEEVNNEKKRLQQLYHIIRIASFEYILPPHISDNIGVISSSHNMNVIISEKFILKAISNYSLNYKSYNNDNAKIDENISNSFWQFYKSNDKENKWKQEKEAQWSRITNTDRKISDAKVKDAVTCIFNGTNHFKLPEGGMILNNLSKLYDNIMHSVEVKQSKGQEEKIFLKIVSLIYARFISNNILFPEDNDYADFNKKITKSASTIKYNLQLISKNLFFFILYGFTINDDQYDDNLFENPYTANTMTKDIFIETLNSLLRSCGLYEIAESLIKLNEPYILPTYEGIRPIGESIGESIDETIDEAIDESIDESIDEPIDEVRRRVLVQGPENWRRIKDANYYRKDIRKNDLNKGGIKYTRKKMKKSKKKSCIKKKIKKTKKTRRKSKK